VFVANTRKFPLSRKLEHFIQNPMHQRVVDAGIMPAGLAKATPLPVTVAQGPPSGPPVALHAHGEAANDHFFCRSAVAA
jgi:hypothetical protein